MRALALFLLMSFAIPTLAEDLIRIEVGGSYENYSKEDLKRRVWQLERAVSQLQEEVFKLKIDSKGRGRGHRGGRDSVIIVSPSPTPSTPPWSCYIEAMGKTFTATATTKSQAKTEVLKQCSDSKGSVFCGENDVKCGND